MASCKHWPSSELYRGALCRTWRPQAQPAQRPSALPLIWYPGPLRCSRRCGQKGHAGDARDTAQCPVPPRCAPRATIGLLQTDRQRTPDPDPGQWFAPLAVWTYVTQDNLPPPRCNNGSEGDCAASSGRRGEQCARCGRVSAATGEIDGATGWQSRRVCVRVGAHEHITARATICRIAGGTGHEL